MRTLPWLSIALCLVGCSEDGISLYLDVRTDLNPGREFTRAVIDPNPAEEGDEVVTEVVDGQDWLHGVRVLEQSGLVAGPLRLSIRLEGGPADLVRGVRIDLEDDFAATVVMTRDCLTSDCPDPGDGFGPACMGGQCVEADCIAERTEGCGPPSCMTAADCPIPSSCAAPACEAGACLAAADAAMCAPDEVCNALLGCATRSRGAVPAIDWVYQPIAGTLGQFRDVATDPLGNYYLTGRGRDADYGGGPVAGDGGDPILVSLDPTGAYRWARVMVSDGIGMSTRGIEGSTPDQGHAVAYDSMNDAVVVVGAVARATDFGAGGTPASAEADLFVAAYAAADGALSWRRRFGGDNLAWGLDVVVDAAGRSYVAGTFTGSIDFDGMRVSTSDTVELDALLVRFDATGTADLVRSLGDPLTWDRAHGLYFDPGGEIVSVGSAIGNADFGGGPLMGNPGLEQLFIASHNSDTFDERFSWNAGEMTSGSSNGLGVGRDTAGNYYVCGNYHREQMLGGETFEAVAFANGWIISVDPSGALRWFHQWGLSPHSDAATSCVVDGADNVWVTGEFDGAADFSGGPLHTLGGDDVYLVSYDSDGNHRFSWSYGGTGGEIGYGLGLANDGGVVLVGSISADGEVGDGTLYRADSIVIKFAP